MYETTIPKTGSKNGDIRYFIFFNDHMSPIEYTLQKVQCMKRWCDDVNKTYVTICLILKDYFSGEKSREGASTYVDHTWQLQPNEEMAQHLLLRLMFSAGQHLSFNDECPF